MKPLSITLAGLLVLAILFGFFYLQEPDESEIEALPTSAYVEILLVGDPFAYSIQNQLDLLRSGLGLPLRLSVRRYNRTYETILANHRDQESYFHLVSFDILWLPELAERGILQPISPEELKAYGFQPEDHHEITLELNTHDDQLFGLPIQPHPELLWYRKDLLEEHGFSPPQNTEELLHQAATLHDPENQLYGIGWNALRGQALGQTITHLYAAFGDPVIDAQGYASVDTKAGKKLCEFLLKLLESSPPDILSMAWDQRIERFTRGQSAFTYGWMARNRSAERDPLSMVQGKVGYLLPPPSPGVEPAVPMGQWSLGIPANLSPRERERAIKTLIYLVSDGADQILFEDGFEGHHRRKGKVVAQKLENNPGYEIVYNLLSEGNISPAARPMIPEWSEVADILGIVFHDMLRGDISIEAALQRGQKKIETLMEQRKPSDP
ncbi:MAG: extracellular solute-binding protein [Opitutales bacterium]|nr:extracellular solute-binding protein [Opitutales bacterium]MCH8541480.1 extracellular solute-binding protein [Opitutales bacterium]